MITSEERRWVWVFGALAALITSLPYLAGFAAQGLDWRYSGLALASEDGYSYLAKMLLGSNGGWLFRTPYTAAPIPYKETTSVKSSAPKPKLASIVFSCN